jgi:hypothetical protein
LKRLFLIFLLGTVAFFCLPRQEAQAMDPVTIALLAPVAIKVAKVASPYVLRGLKSAGVGMIKAGKAMIQIFLLPLGFLEMTFGAPFGFFKPGVKDTVKGAIAPFKFCFYTLMVPVRLCAVGAF